VILCICRAVTDREVDDIIRQGASTADAVGQMCGAGTDCGACVGSIEERICKRTGGRCTGCGAHAHDASPAPSPLSGC
jgi:bacterioferritin-associated ferredoxin